MFVLTKFILPSVLRPSAAFGAGPEPSAAVRLENAGHLRGDLLFAPEENARFVSTLSNWSFCRRMLNAFANVDASIGFFVCLIEISSNPFFVYLYMCV